MSARAETRAGPLSFLHPAEVLLAAAVVAVGGLLVAWQAGIMFGPDDWAVLLHRPGFGAGDLLAPHNEHIVLAQVLIYKALLAVFGMDSPQPFQVVAVLAFLASIVFVFAYVRDRVGEWPALAAVLPILVLGPAWEDLLAPFQIGFFGSMAFGLAALAALEREERRWDALACVLLVICVAFSTLGLLFTLAAAIALSTRPGLRQRSFVVLVPAVLFALWWLGWGRDADTNLTLDNLLSSPGFVFDGFAASLASLLGLAHLDGDYTVDVLTIGRPLLVVVLVLAAVRLYRLGRLPRGLAVSLALGAGFWFLTALNAGPARTPETSRYLYIGAIFVVLIAADLARGIRVGRPAAAVMVTVALVASASNLRLLNEPLDGLRQYGELQRGGLAALEIARARVYPAFELTAENSVAGLQGVLDAGNYLTAVAAHGSPAYSAAELQGASALARNAADRVLASSLGLGLERASLGKERCLAARPGDGGVVVLPPEGAVLIPGGPDSPIRIRRYSSTSFPVELPTVAAGEPVRLAIPLDFSSEPWELDAEAGAGFTVCAAGRR